MKSYRHPSGVVATLSVPHPLLENYMIKQGYSPVEEAPVEEVPDNPKNKK